MVGVLVDPHAEACLEALRTAALPNGDLIPVGDGVAPKSTVAGQVVSPCIVFHPLGGLVTAASVAEPTAEVKFRWQATCVGDTARQARIVADAAVVAVEASAPSIEGRSVIRFGRPHDAPPMRPAQRDPDLTPPKFYVPVELLLWTDPAPGEES